MDNDETVRSGFTMTFARVCESDLKTHGKATASVKKL